MNGGENRALETASLFADCLSEEVFVTLGEARRIGGFALRRARPAGAVGGDAVGVELWGYGGAGDGERVARGGAGGDANRSVGVMDGQSPSIRTIGRGGSVAELVDAGDDATELVVVGASYREADLG